MLKDYTRIHIQFVKWQRQATCISGIFNKLSIRNHPNVAQYCDNLNAICKPRSTHMCETCKTIVSINRFINVNTLNVKKR